MSAETKNHFRSWITDQSEAVFHFRANSCFVCHSSAACDWLHTTQLVNAYCFLEVVGKQPLDGSGFSFQQTFVEEERVTKP